MENIVMILKVFKSQKKISRKIFFHLQLEKFLENYS